MKYTLYSVYSLGKDARLGQFSMGELHYHFVTHEGASEMGTRHFVKEQDVTEALNKLRAEKGYPPMYTPLTEEQRLYKSCEDDKRVLFDPKRPEKIMLTDEQKAELTTYQKGLATRVANLTAQLKDSQRANSMLAGDYVKLKTKYDKAQKYIVDNEL